jgi:Na+-translocating ferredoxin:NAD+ oxidoreductase RnfA subunit
VALSCPTSDVQAVQEAELVDSGTDTLTNGIGLSRAMLVVACWASRPLQTEVPTVVRVSAPVGAIVSVAEHV